MDKIDFVIPWVDGADQEWINEKKEYLPIKNQDNSNVRYRNWDNLHYIFRGIEKFAPWVNKVFLITWGHLPNWLNIYHPQIRIVKHEDYIPGKYLPTFNGHTIELNLHRIKDLSEYFVYFNDDIFIINNVSEDDFFYNELPCDLIALEPTLPTNDTISRIIYNDTAVINDHFEKKLTKIFAWENISSLTVSSIVKSILLSPYGRYSGFNNPHFPNSFTKTLFSEIWKEEYDILNSTCQNKFRSPTDVNQWLMRYWYLAKGEFKYRKKGFCKYFSISNNNIDLNNHIIKQKSKLVCCNDNEIIIDFEKEKKALIESLNIILPEKSIFEI